MKHLHKLAALFLVLAMVGLFVGILPAEADQPVAGNEGTAIVNATSGVGGVVAINSSTGNKLELRALTLSTPTAGVVTLHDGNGGGDVIAAFYLAANTPRDIGSDILGKGIRTTAGNSLSYTHTAAVTGTFRYRTVN